LSGLEQAVKACARNKDKVHVSIYADDFIITAASKEVLETQVKPCVENFLRERGLELSVEKTKIVHIQEGFNFLGFNIRKYGDKLIIKPAKESVKRFLTNIREVIKKSRATKTENLIQQMNPKIRSWTNYYRNVVSKETFTSVDAQIFKALWKWA
jgi:RNA-directed DNA polymerase